MAPRLVGNISFEYFDTVASNRSIMKFSLGGNRMTGFLLLACMIVASVAAESAESLLARELRSPGLSAGILASLGGKRDVEAAELRARRSPIIDGKAVGSLLGKRDV